jgi:hypothetical protein
LILFKNYANKYINTGLLIIPIELINDQNNILDMNDEVKLWVEEEFEFDAEFKFSEYELEQSKKFKRLVLNE